MIDFTTPPGKTGGSGHVLLDPRYIEPGQEFTFPRSGTGKVVRVEWDHDIKAYRIEIDFPVHGRTGYRSDQTRFWGPDPVEETIRHLASVAAGALAEGKSLQQVRKAVWFANHQIGMRRPLGMCLPRVSDEEVLKIVRDTVRRWDHGGDDDLVSTIRDVLAKDLPDALAVIEGRSR
jgi:hypothetical protein